MSLIGPDSDMDPVRATRYRVSQFEAGTTELSFAMWVAGRLSSSPETYPYQPHNGLAGVP
jgi:hypothetical protein